MIKYVAFCVCLPVGEMGMRKGLGSSGDAVLDVGIMVNYMVHMRVFVLIVRN